MQNYLRDLARLEILPNDILDDYLHYYYNTKDDPKGKKTLYCRNEIVKSHLRLVISVAKNYRNCGILLEDLVSEGNIGLINALDKNNPELGLKFNTYAVFHIRERILNRLKKEHNNIKIPEYIKAAIIKWDKECIEFFNRNLRHGESHEINRKLGFKPKVVGYIIAAKNAHGIQSFLAGGIDVSDSIIDIHAQSPLNEIIDKENLEEVYSSINKLKPRTRDIVTGRIKGITLKALSETHNISLQRVHQIYIDGLKEIRLEHILTKPFVIKQEKVETEEETEEVEEKKGEALETA